MYQMDLVDLIRNHSFHLPHFVDDVPEVYEFLVLNLDTPLIPLRPKFLLISAPAPQTYVEYVSTSEFQTFPIDIRVELAYQMDAQL